MNIDKTREQFESYWTARCNELCIECSLTMFSNGEYCNNSAHYAWAGWKASRESLTVEFPEEMEPDLDGDDYCNKVEAAYCKGYNQALSDIESNVESAGIKVVSK